MRASLASVSIAELRYCFKTSLLSLLERLLLTKGTIAAESDNMGEHLCPGSVF